MAESEFCFEVPNCSPGVTLRLTAPDGIVLQLPLPAEADPGDKIHLFKSLEGKWCLKHIVKCGVARTDAKKRSREELEKDLEGPDAVRIRLDTTKGTLLLKVVPSWAPLGVKRFLELVDDGFYKDIAIYRGIPNFLIQFGVVKDTLRSDYGKIADDPLCGVPYLDGTVGFAAAGPNTRTSTMCLFLGDAPHLGQSSVETPIGMVLPESMATLHSIFLPGDIPQCRGTGPCPQKLAELGNDYIRKDFPHCDFITGASRA